MKTIIRLFLLLTFFSNQIKAQDDSNVGFYVDGIKVNDLTCYSFKKLTVVFPFNSSYSNFSQFAIWTDIEKTYPTSTYIISKAKLLSSVKGKYIVLEVFKEDVQQTVIGSNYSGIIFSRGSIATYFGGDKEGGEKTLHLQLVGQTISGYTEQFDDGCSCIKKEPTYKDETLGEPAGVLLKNRKKAKNSLISMIDQSYPNVKLEEPCTYSGNKVDFNNLGGVSSSNSGSGNVTINNTVIVKNEVSTTTNNTSTSSNAVTPSALKPLDKNKPGYFVEKDGAQISKEGYKKGDALNGEVRTYDEGKIREVSFYVNDKKNGPSTMYYENGKIEMTGNYKNDEKDGEWKEYNDSGKLKETKKYLNGEVQD